MTKREDEIFEVLKKEPAISQAELASRPVTPTSARLISVVGDDLYGRRILEEAASIGLYTRDTIVQRDRQSGDFSLSEE